MALKNGKSVIFNAFIYYTKIAKPALKFGKKPTSTPHGNREYVVDVLVTEEDYGKLKKKFKTVKSIKDAREFDAKEFEEAFKVAPPYEAENYIVVKFKKSADYQDGNATPKPIVKAAKGCTERVTVSTEIGNGSEAHVQWKEREWKYEGKNGLSLDLAALGIVNLVPYSGGETELDFDVEDDVEFDEEEGMDEDQADNQADNPSEEEGDDNW